MEEHKAGMEVNVAHSCTDQRMKDKETTQKTEQADFRTPESTAAIRETLTKQKVSATEQTSVFRKLVVQIRQRR